MSSSSSVHHVEIGVKDGQRRVRELVNNYSFYVAAERNSKCAYQWLLKSKSGDIHFVITEIKNENECELDDYCSLWYLTRQVNELNLHTTDTRLGECQNNGTDSVFNIAFDVKDLSTKLSELCSKRVEVVRDLRVVTDEDGSVSICTIKSIVGNVLHTLIDTSQYNGLFLPGFSPVQSPDFSSISSDILFTSIDHFTYVCPQGCSQRILQWYENCFGMKRFFINSEEEESEGFVINEKGIGLRMKAMEYWKCAEVGLRLPGVSSMKFVIAEALPNQSGPNQIDTFLSEHGGPGIQHIGLLTSDIIQAVRVLKCNGVEFAETPSTYYTELGRRHDIESVGENLAALKDLGILIDTEEGDLDEADASPSSSVRYLMQKFTKPLFDRQTFFLEVIQRQGATGFGAGNITALFRSVQAYMHQTQLASS